MAKGLQLGGDVGKEITVSLPESIESESAGRSTEWANVTRHIRTVAQRLQELDHHYVENEKMPLHIDNTLWSLERWLNVAHVGNSDGHSSSASANPQACRVSLTRKLVGSRGLATKECKEEQRLGPQHK